MAEEEDNPFAMSMVCPSYAYLWGYGGWGALIGTNDEDTNVTDLERPTLLRSPALDGLQLKQIVCTKRGTLFLTGCGKVFACGSNLGLNLPSLTGWQEAVNRPDESQLGLEEQSFVATPTINPHLAGQRTIMLACGAGLTVALSVDGRVFACGQLLETIPTPRVVLPASKGVNQIACGDRFIAAWRGPLSSSVSQLRAKIRRTVDPNATLSGDMRTLIDQDQCSDLLLLLGDGTSMHAHRILLAMRSDKLKAILTDRSHTDERNSGEAEGEAAKKTSLCLPPQVETRALLIFLEYLYCDELPSLPAAFFLHAERRRQGDDAVAANIKDDIVGQLLLLAKEYGTKAFEDLLEKLVAFPRLSSTLEPAPVSGTLSSDIARALEEPLFSDLTFLVTPPDHRDYSAGDEAPASKTAPQEPTEIPAHKCLLAPRSDYFRAMFLNGLKEATSRRVPIVGLAPDAFRCILRYQYSGVVEEIDPDRVVDLFMAGNKFGMDALMKPCERMIASGLDMENVTELWGVATSFESEQLKQLCISFLHKEFNRPSISVDQVAKLPLDLVKCVCTRMVAAPDYSQSGTWMRMSQIWQTVFSPQRTK